MNVFLAMIAESLGLVADHFVPIRWARLFDI